MENEIIEIGRMSLPIQVHKNGNLIDDKFLTFTPNPKQLLKKANVTFGSAKKKREPLVRQDQDESADMTMTTIFNFQNLEDSILPEKEATIHPDESIQKHIEEIKTQRHSELVDDSQLDQSLDMTMTQMFNIPHPEQTMDDGFEPSVIADRPLEETQSLEIDRSAEMSMTIMFPNAGTFLTPNESASPSSPDPSEPCSELPKSPEQSFGSEQTLESGLRDQTFEAGSEEQTFEVGMDGHNSEVEMDETNLVSESGYPKAIHLTESDTQTISFPSSSLASQHPIIELSRLRDSSVKIAEYHKQILNLVGRFANFRVPLVFPNDSRKQGLFEKCLLTPMITKIRVHTKKLGSALKEAKEQLELLREQAAIKQLESEIASDALINEKYQRMYECFLASGFEDSLEALAKLHLSTEPTVFLERDLQSLRYEIKRLEDCNQELSVDLDYFHAQRPHYATPEAGQTSEAIPMQMMNDLASSMQLFESYQQIHRWVLQPSTAEQLNILFPTRVRDYLLRVDCQENKASLTISSQKMQNECFDFILNPKEIIENWHHSPNRKVSQLLETFSFAIIKAEQAL